MLLANLWLDLQAIASPRELLLKKVPFPLPKPDIFNLDEINALTVDTVVSENGKYTLLDHPYLNVSVDPSTRGHFEIDPKQCSCLY